MNVLVAGGAGYIGSHLIGVLRQAGIITVDTFHEQIAACKALALQPAAPGPRARTNAGQDADAPRTAANAAARSSTIGLAPGSKVTGFPPPSNTSYYAMGRTRAACSS